MPLLPPDETGLARAADHLHDGGLVAFPTETVYGLGGDATSPTAVAAIFEAKARPTFNPLIVHVRDLAAAEVLGTFDAAARSVAESFWPGPLSIVVPRQVNGAVCDLACAGGETVALRVPAHPVAQSLLKKTGLPLAAPSANPSGRLSPTTAQHVAEGFPGSDIVIVNGGPCPIGLESTVVACTGDGSLRLLRNGAVSREELAERAGAVDDETEPQGDNLPSPGMLARHYAPRIPLRLHADTAEPDEALLAFGPDVPAGAATTRNLSATGDLKEAAANLFAMLHELEQSSARCIAVMSVPEDGLGRAINDRLRRGAAASVCPTDDLA
ncbi:MAG: L-threonylcarbamoyladenylate synthase [Pseudomonadota bacterium]